MARGLIGGSVSVSVVHVLESNMVGVNVIMHYFVVLSSSCLGRLGFRAFEN